MFTRDVRLTCRKVQLMGIQSIFLERILGGSLLDLNVRRPKMI